MGNESDKGGVVRQQNTPGEPGAEIVLQVCTFPNSIEMLNRIIDERVDAKLNKMMNKILRAGRK